MTKLISLYIILIFLLFPFIGFSQPVNHSIDSIIHLVTTGTYRIHFDSLRTTEGCNRKVYDSYSQLPDHDACRDYIYKTFKKYLGEENVYLHHFEVNGNGGLANVVAFKEGRSASKGILIISAHYDSNNGREESDLNPQCSPGANDNGTGIAAILEIARVLSGVETDHSILFAAWDLEEQFPVGFAGGSNSWFTDHIVKKKKTDWGKIKSGEKINIEKLVANVNFDMFGHPGDTIDGKPVLWACSGNISHSGFIKEYVSTFNRYVTETLVVNHGKLTYSDHYTFAARKIPSVENLESGYDKDPFYHTCLDNLQNRENIDFNFAVNVTRGGMAFILERAGIFFTSDKKVSADSFPIFVSELPGEYIISTQRDEYTIMVVDQFGNKVNTMKSNGFSSLCPPFTGLYNIFIFNRGGKSSTNLFLQKKEGHNVPFF
jgi:hypothetical protein